MIYIQHIAETAITTLSTGGVLVWRVSAVLTRLQVSAEAMRRDLDRHEAEISAARNQILELKGAH